MKRYHVLIVSLLLCAAAESAARAEPPRAAPNSPSDGEAAGDSEASVRTSFAADRPPDSPPPRAAVDRLRARIDEILEREVEPAAEVGIFAVDSATGSVLYRRNADRPQNPASNLKLVTSAAALDHFGPFHTFETSVVFDPDDRDGARLEGPLYLHSDGAPYLLYEDVLAWSSAVDRAGIETVEGDLIVDDTAFEGDYLPPGFDQKDEDDSYRAPIGAVSVHFNSVRVTVTPGEGDDGEPNVDLHPPNDYVDLVADVRTLPGDGQSIDFASEPSRGRRTTIRVTGAIGADSAPVVERLRIDYPSRFSGSVLARALASDGIQFEGEVRRGDVPEEGATLHSAPSHPLSYAILAMNKWSNNFMAEQLLRTLGGGEQGEPSTWERARSRVRSFLARAGLESEGFELHNGSGLYDGNALSARSVVRLLVYMSDHRWWPEYLSSLSIAGRDGTLEERMTEPPAAGRLRGKTGTLNDVSALSGWVRTRSGRPVAFSILFDETPEKGWRYRGVLDAIAVELASFED